MRENSQDMRGNWFCRDLSEMYSGLKISER